MMLFQVYLNKEFHIKFLLEQKRVMLVATIYSEQLQQQQQLK
jgi:hypothetical protein